MVNDNGGNDAGSTVLQESLDSVRAVGRVHHTEAAVKRIVCRLEGGAKAENLKHICRASK